MLVATFGPATGWVGKKITHDNGQFALEGHGAITAIDVMEYDRQGFLDWATPGSRAFVGAKAQAAASPAPVTMGIAAVSPGLAKDIPDTPAAGDSRTDGQKAASIIGLLLLVFGLLAAIYFAAIFDVSVPVDYQDGASYGMPDRVNNIGLMSDRQNGIIFSFAAAIAGGVLMVVGRKRARPPVASSVAAPALAGPATAKGICNACGGVMDAGVAFCPHCGQKLSWTSAGPPADAT